MNAFTRITIIGSERRTTLALPSDDAVSAHLGVVVSTVQEPNRNSALYGLVSLTGEPLETERSLADQGVLDGSAFRLVPTNALPAPPEVSDVSDVLFAEHDRRFEPRSGAHRRVAARIVVGAAAVLGLAALQDPLQFGLALAVLLVGTATALPLFVWGSAAWAWTITSLALGAVPTLAPRLIPADAEAGTAIMAYALLGWCVLGGAPGLGGRVPGLRPAASIGIVLSGSGVVAAWFVADPVYSQALLGVLALLLLGIIPGIAVTVSGVASFDDSALGGARPARTRVLAGIADAYASLGWLAVAASAALASALVTLLASTNLWFAAQGAAIAIVALLRSRLFPLASASWSIWAAVGIGACAGVLSRDGIPPLIPLVAAALLGVIAALLASLSPSDHARVRLRRLGDAVETITAVSTIPLLCGGFGLYSMLLGVFA